MGCEQSIPVDDAAENRENKTGSNFNNAMAVGDLGGGGGCDGVGDVDCGYLGGC
jgi:hypothetical protein